MNIGITLAIYARRSRSFNLLLNELTIGHDHEEVAVLGDFLGDLTSLTNEDNKERMYNIAMKDNLISTRIHL